MQVKVKESLISKMRKKNGDETQSRAIPIKTLTDYRLQASGTATPAISAQCSA